MYFGVTRTFACCVFLYFVESASKGLLSDRLRGFDLIRPEDVGHRIEKRGADASDNQYNHLEDVRFSALDKSFRLTLTPRRGLFANNFEITTIDAKGVKTLANIDRQAFYNGHVIGEGNSRVNLYMEDKQFIGTIQTAEETYYFEPADTYLPSITNATLVYRLSDVVQNETETAKFCGAVAVDDIAGVPHAIQNGNLDDTLADRNKREIPTYTPTHTRCGLRLVADHRFFESIGGKSIKRTITYLINLIDRVNGIYNGTNWNVDHEKDPLLGYGFIIEAINVLTETTNVKSGEAHYNDGVPRKDSKEILDLFSRDPDHNKYCLAHLFTDQILESGVLGLAYVGNGRRGSPGGVCSAPDVFGWWNELLLIDRSLLLHSEREGAPEVLQSVVRDVTVLFSQASNHGAYQKEGSGPLLYLNSGLTSARNQFNQIVITREMELVTAHELGHNWGSQHDPENEECTPRSGQGGRYLMYMYSVTGLEENNKLFSPCTRRMVRDVLLSKSSSCFKRPEKSLCGNFLVEEGEECDAGYIGNEDKDYCCTRDCKLRPGAVCSNRNSPCCEDCQYATNQTECIKASSLTCHGASRCTGKSADCPTPPPAPDGTFCFDGGQCRKGQCMSFCETKGMRSCVCDNITESCLVCCRHENHTCHPYDFSALDRKTYQLVPDGRPCIQGTCSKGICQKTSVDFVARMWNVIERINFNNFARVLKNNIVGAVIILSLLVWIPLSCLVHQIDKKFERENPAAYGTLKKSVIASSRHDVNQTPLMYTPSSGSRLGSATNRSSISSQGQLRNFSLRPTGTNVVSPGKSPRMANVTLDLLKARTQQQSNLPTKWQRSEVVNGHEDTVV